MEITDFQLTYWVTDSYKTGKPFGEVNGKSVLEWTHSSCNWKYAQMGGLTQYY